MTEAEWLASTNPLTLVMCVEQRFRMNRTKAGRRKLRLFGCGCCRLVWPYVAGSAAAMACVERAERAADCPVNWDDYERDPGRFISEVMDGCSGVDTHGPAVRTAVSMLAGRSLTGVSVAAVNVASVLEGEAADSRRDLGRHRVVDLLHCVVGNPFRPVAFAPEWRTSSALALAETIYEHRAFDRLPILADALEEAGCDQPDVLRHCREHAVHARGCWVVDGVLGKACRSPPACPAARHTL